MIYCVEDDSSIRDLMIYTLTIAGFEAKGFADSAAFWSEMQTGSPELVLSIVKHAAMIHDARIRVSSELGKGSVFTVDFPKYLAEG